MIPLVAFVAVIIVIVMVVLLVSIPLALRQREKFVAFASATTPGCISSMATLPPFVRPLASLDIPNPNPNPQGVEARRAYHYDPRAETWERDVDNARREFLDTPLKNKIRIDAASYVKLDEEKLPLMNVILGKLGDTVLHMMHAQSTHATALLQVTGAWRPTRPDCFDAIIVTFVHCAHAEGKRYGLCTTGSAIVHVGGDDVESITVLNLQSAGAASEADLYL